MLSSQPPVLKPQPAHSHSHLYFALAIIIPIVIAAGVLISIKNFATDQEIDSATPIPQSCTSKGGSALLCSKARAGMNIPTSTPQTDLKDWKTYTNSQYGFEMMFPSRWSAMTVDQAKDADLGDQFIFNLEGQPICYIAVYTNTNWDIVQKDGRPGNDIPIKFTTKGNLTYGWNCGQDDYGYKGFEDYNKTIDNKNFADINNGKILGPFAEFQSVILPTFKFTNKN